MSVLPLNESGDPRKEVAARMNHSPHQQAVDALGESVKAVQMGRWLDEAIAMCRKAAADPAEFQRLGIWLQRMRRALP